MAYREQGPPLQARPPPPPAPPRQVPRPGPPPPAQPPQQVAQPLLAQPRPLGRPLSLLVPLYPVSCCSSWNTQQRALAIIPAAGASDAASSAGGAGGDSSTAASPPAVVSPGVGSTAGAPAASSTGASTTTTVVVLLTTVFDAWGGEALAGVFAAVAVGSAAFDPEQPIAPARSCAQVDPFGGWTVCTRKVLLILKDRPGADDQGFLMRLSVFANFWGIQRAKTCQKESFGDHPGSLSE